MLPCPQPDWNLWLETAILLHDNCLILVCPRSDMRAEVVTTCVNTSGLFDMSSLGILNNH